MLYLLTYLRKIHDKKQTMHSFYVYDDGIMNKKISKNEQFDNFRSSRGMIL